MIDTNRHEIDRDKLRKIIDSWNEKTIAEYDRLVKPETDNFSMFNPDSVPDANFYDCKGE